MADRLGHLMPVNLVAGVLAAVTFSAEPTSVNATPICPTTSCLAAHDINDIELGMTIAEVSRLFGDKLKPLGSGQFQGERDRVSYDLGFSSHGHLFRINSNQELGQFEPDANIAATLTKRLSQKYGPPQRNQLPGGIASWEFVKKYEENGSQYMLFTETLYARFATHYQAPTTLELQLMDRRLERRDDAIKNSGPSAMAAAAAHF